MASSLRDRLIECFNDTNEQISEKDPKRVFYLSSEFLLGRLMQNILINSALEDNYKDALMDLGYKLEEIYENEHEAGLGNAG